MVKSRLEIDLPTSDCQLPKEFNPIGSEIEFWADWLNPWAIGNLGGGPIGIGQRAKNAFFPYAGSTLLASDWVSRTKGSISINSEGNFWQFALLAIRIDCFFQKSEVAIFQSTLWTFSEQKSTSEDRQNNQLTIDKSVNSRTTFWDKIDW
jgi:hypothetical protein